MMSFIVDKAQRDSFKRAMIQAQLSSELKISSKDKD